MLSKAYPGLLASIGQFYLSEIPPLKVQCTVFDILDVCGLILTGTELFVIIESSALLTPVCA